MGEPLRPCHPAVEADDPVQVIVADGLEQPHQGRDRPGIAGSAFGCPEEFTTGHPLGDRRVINHHDDHPVVRQEIARDCLAEREAVEDWSEPFVVIHAGDLDPTVGSRLAHGRGEDARGCCGEDPTGGPDA